ncbi:hypothetical protein Nepgr_004109 [Nepenthes gracilis]|uniref:Uncharacterized protein n=1 Tax=Nepenthes gracilis TaxID=150966 RepID=A0AAD3S0R6_NEPGR|nr:hypothetical protein Nepgr_004109 [Nepenthes gracilis]
MGLEVKITAPNSNSKLTASETRDRTKVSYPINYQSKRRSTNATKPRNGVDTVVRSMFLTLAALLLLLLSFCSIPFHIQCCQSKRDGDTSFLMESLSEIEWMGSPYRCPYAAAFSI